jgi:hypothetical protein
MIDQKEPKFDMEMLELAHNMTWDGSARAFVECVRILLGLDTEGPPPYWHLFEAIKNREAR